MTYTEFIAVYCRWVPSDHGDRLSLREKAGYDCIFWKGGCTIYAARPLQCRSFPFWRSVLSSKEAWDITKTGCPGMDTGWLHDRYEIEAVLAAQEAERIITKKALKARGRAGAD
jgi:Fe-S-cluster containining protein